MNKKIIVLSAIALSAALIAPVFAQTNSATGVTSGTPVSSTLSGAGGKTTTVGSLPPATLAEKITCVGTATDARESALATGYTAYAQAMTAAYSARETAFQQAYGATSTKQVRVGINAAWNAFYAAQKSAVTAWNSTRNGAWNTFYAAQKSCKAPASVVNG